MKIALGADHAGYQLKEKIKAFLEKKSLAFSDFGTFSVESSDYPEYAYKVANAVTNGDFDRGILICGTGMGMCITANKFKGIRAVGVQDPEIAKITRLHNDANVLCLAGRFLSEENAIKIVDVWINTPFEGGRHQKRVDLIAKLTGL